MEPWSDLLSDGPLPWSIINFSREKTRQVNKIYLIWVLSVFRRWTRIVFISYAQ